MASEAIQYHLSGTVAGTPVQATVTAEGLGVGRSHECGLTVLDPEASRLHCVVGCRDGKVTVEDRSQNGTSVNGTRIASVTELKPGDIVKIGSTELVLKEGAAPAAPAAPATADTPAASAPISASVLQPGDMVDRYRIQRLIGKGGMGTVYEAVHTGLDLPRALKALTLPNDPAYAGFRSKFLDEGKILARLRHENITQVHDAAYDEKTQTLFFAMDLVLYDDGKPCTLADVAYDECDVSNWFASLASALDYIHGQGIVHSDLKLQNVLVSPGQKIKLADFGVAHLLSGKMRSSLRGEGEAGGKETIGYTAHYVSPEILKNGALPSVASDVYALGVLLVKLLSGKWYDEQPTVLNEIAAKRGLNWRPVLAQMLCADPKRRPTNLLTLVTQLRHGSKAPMRRKFQIENRRRRSQKVRLQRAVNIKTDRMQPTAFAPEPKRNKIVLWALLAAMAVAAAFGVVWMSRSNAAREEAERERLERLSTARGQAQWKVKRSRDAFEERVRQIKDEIGRHREDYAFVADLCQANVTGSTDRATATRRNEIIREYGSVLKSIGDLRTALAGFNPIFRDIDEQLSDSPDVAAIQSHANDFETAYREGMQTLESACAGEKRAWDGYARAKARIDQAFALRAQIDEDRRQTLEAVSRAMESEPELKTTSELAEAKAKIEEGDRLIGKGGNAAIADCYAAARASLSNGCERLRATRAEADAIAQLFQRCDETIRRTELTKLRHGQSGLADVASRAKAVSEKFAEKWKADCRHPCHTGLVDNCSFVLRAQASYLNHLAGVLQRPHGGLNFSLTANGVRVANKRFFYDFSWPAVFSSRRQDTRTKENYRQMILDFCNVPTDLKIAARGLAGRWIVLKELMPGLNTEDETNRLVQVLRQSDSGAARSWAQRELPTLFPADDVPPPAAPALSFEDFPQAPGEAQTDLAQERLVFFVPSQGLSLSAIGPGVVEIAMCSRLKGTRFIRFSVNDGELCGADSGAWRSVADIEEGKPFDVRGESMPGVCRYWPIQWIDNALGNGLPLLLIRCQYLPPASDEP